MCSLQPPSARAAQDSPQLGLYQLAVLEGAVVAPDLQIEGVGGAALMPLRKGRPQEQDPLTRDADGRTWVHGLLEGLVTAIASEQFPARRNDGCETCQVRRCCPARPEGTQVA